MTKEAECPFRQQFCCLTRLVSCKAYLQSLPEERAGIKHGEARTIAIFGALRVRCSITDVLRANQNALHSARVPIRKY